MRARILRIGSIDRLDEDHWYLSGWFFAGIPVGMAPVSYDADGRLIAVAGWSLSDLQGISAAEWELAGLEVTDQRL